MLKDKSITSTLILQLKSIQLMCYKLITPFIILGSLGTCTGTPALDPPLPNCTKNCTRRSCKQWGREPQEGVCLPVVGGGAGVYPSGQTNPPPVSTPLLGRHLPLGRHPRAEIPLGKHRLVRHPPWANTPQENTPSIRYPLPCGQTDACENITFVNTSYAVGN